MPASPSLRWALRHLVMSRSWAWWVLGVVGVLAVVALVVFTIGPAPQHEPQPGPGEADGVECAEGLAEQSPEDTDSPVASWGEAEHELVPLLSAEEYRETVEELAEGLGYEPVAEIPAETEADDTSLSFENDVSSDEVVVMTLSDSESFHVTGIDVATWEPEWHWTLEEDGGVRIHDHGEHLVMSHSVSAPDDSAGGAFTIELISLQQTTGKQEGCKRFDSDFGLFSYHPSSDTSGVLVTRAQSSDTDEEAYGQWAQQVSLPDFPAGFSEYFPNLEYMDGKVGAPGRWQSMSGIDEDLFIAYAYGFYQEGLIAAGSAHSDFDQDLVPVRAFSMETGERIWDLGEPGDQTAFVTAVPDAVRDGTGLLVAEFGEFHPSDDDPEEGSSSVTLQMYDQRANLLWELPTQDSQDFSGHDFAVLEGLILVQNSPDEVTAVEAGTGDSLWSLDVSEEEGHPVRLSGARDFGDSLFIPGFDERYLVDPQTGERDDPAAEDAMSQAYVHDISPLGEDHLILHSGRHGDTILRSE